MRVQALLCDAASVREGLIHILGGGVTRLWRQSFPAAIDCDLALMIIMEQVEIQDRHRLRVIVQGADGQPVASLDGEFSASRNDSAPAGPGAHQPGEVVFLPLVIPLRGAAVPSPGAYSIEILVDSQHQQSLPLVAAPTDQKPPTLP